MPPAYKELVEVVTRIAAKLNIEWLAESKDACPKSELNELLVSLGAEAQRHYPYPTKVTRHRPQPGTSEKKASLRTASLPKKVPRKRP